MAEKLPAFQFYPGDWRKDPALRRCSLGARGVWIEMLCLMFECDARGVLSTGGSAWTPDEVCTAIGGDAAEVKSYIAELVSKGVCACNSAGAFFSRRMVRDEELRRVRAEAGSKGGKAKSKNRKELRRHSKTLANDVAKPKQNTEGEVEDSSLGVQSNGNGKSRARAGPFVRPTIDDVRAYCQERENAVDPLVFWNFYQSNGWRVGKNPMKDWRACVHTWERNSEIRGLDKTASRTKLPDI